MKNSYRINVRFDKDNPEESHCLEHLKTLPGSWSKYIVEAVMEKVRRDESEHMEMIDCIRKVFREELSNLSFVSLGSDTKPQSNTSAENDEEDILNSLSAFGL